MYTNSVELRNKRGQQVSVSPAISKSIWNWVSVGRHPNASSNEADFESHLAGLRPAPSPLKRRPNRMEPERKPPAIMKPIFKPPRAVASTTTKVIQRSARIYNNIPVSESKQIMRQMKKVVNPMTKFARPDERTFVKPGPITGTRPQQKPAVRPQQKPAVRPQQKPVTPQQKQATSQQKPATPEQKPATPQQKPETAQQKQATSQQKSATPQQKPVTRQQKPTTPQQKPATPQEQPAPATVDTVKDITMEKPHEKSVAEKLETETPPVENTQETTASEEPTPEGHYELNPLMTRVLESELQRIMIKVWQELPDSPHIDADKIFTDKFRSKAGDAFKNALGLNVAKRLLNVHNPLYMRLKLSQKPESGALKQFQHKYNCSELRQKPENPTMYIAQMRSFDDFDHLFTAKDVKCGSAKVAVAACYKFTQCPPILRTMYSAAENKSTDKEITAESVEAGNKIDKPNEVKTINKSDSNVSIQNSNETDENKSISIENKGIEEKIAEKNSSKVEPTTEATKPSQKPTDVKETKDNNTEIEVSGTKVGASNVAKKTAITTSTEDKAIHSKVNEDKDNEVKDSDKVNDQKAGEIKDNKKNASDTKNMDKKINEINDSEKQTNETNDNKKKTNANEKKAIERKDNKANENKDYDELDDQDILALMSDGIVLDECSGSDED